MLTRPSWVLFDAADTLLRPAPTVATVYHQIGQQFGSPLTAAEITRRFKPALARHFGGRAAGEEEDRRAWRELVFDVLQVRNDELFNTLWEHFAQSRHWRLFDDVEPTWSWLHRQGFRLAIASNFDRRLINIVSDFRQIQPEHVFLSSQLGYRKPNINFFQAIQAELGVAAERLLLIGDSVEADYEGARAAGWQALLIDRSRTEDNSTAICRLTSLRHLAK